MAYLYLLQEAERHLRRERVFRDRNNPLEILDDHAVIRKYRLSRECIIDLCEDPCEDLERPTRRNRALSVQDQILCALRFYATGSFQEVIGDRHGLNKSSVSRSIHAVSASLCRRVRQHISYPEDQASIQRLKHGFLSEM